MKKTFLLLPLVLVLLISVTNAEEITLNKGESIEKGGYEVLLKNIQIDKTVISVDQESKILRINEEEDFPGLKIELLEITILGENSGFVKVNIQTLYTCGDGNCEGPETKDSCCKDCGCQSGFECEENKCIQQGLNECDKDEDCDDSIETTTDRCSGTPRKCQHFSTLICDKDEDCNDDNPCTEDKCTNNDCFNTAIQDCPQDEVPQDNIEEDQDTTEQESNQEIEEKKSFIQRILDFFRRIF